VLHFTTVGTIFPHYWTGVHLHEKSENLKWLNIMTSNLGCYTCILINNLRPTNGEFKIRREWVNRSIKKYGESEEQKQWPVQKKL